MRFPGKASPAGSQRSERPEHTPAADPLPPQGRRLWVITLSAALTTALLGWVIGESGVLAVRPLVGQYTVMGQKIQGPTPETRRVADTRTGALVYGAFGLLLGSALGLVGRPSALRPMPALAAGAVGAVLGGVAGALPSLTVLPAYFGWIGDSLGDLLPSLAMHSLIWTPLGGAAGLSFALGRRDRSGIARAFLGGAAGALLGTAVYEVLGAAALSLSGTVNPIATTRPARLLTFLLLAIPTAAGVLLAGQPLRRHDPAADAGR